MSVLVPVIDYIDGATRRIYLLQGVDAFHWIDDVYREYLNLRGTNESLQKWYPMMNAKGNEPKDDVKSTPRYVTLLQGCRVIPYDENILITVTGEAITDNPDVDPDPFDTTTRSNPLKLYITPPAAEIVKDVDSLAAIAFMSFNNEVTIDVLNGSSIAGFLGDPNLLGNGQYPVSSMEEGLQIAHNKGITKLKVLNSTILSSGDYSEFYIEGLSHVNTSMVVDSNPDVSNVKLSQLRISGYLDGGTEVHECLLIDTVYYFNGHIHDSALGGHLILGGATESFISNCTRLSNELVPVIDFDDGANHLVLSNYTGVIACTNMTHTDANAMIGLNQGVIILDSENATAGMLTCIGIGYLVDELGNSIETGMWNGMQIINRLVSKESVANAVLDEVA